LVQPAKAATRRAAVAESVDRLLADVLADPAEAWALSPDQARGLLPRIAALVAVLQARAATREPQQPVAEPAESTPKDDTLLTPEQVATVLGVEVAAVARLCRPFRRKLGHRTYRYAKSDVDALMRGGA
jgi:hypothetical protein